MRLLHQSKTALYRRESSFRQGAALPSATTPLGRTQAGGGRGVLFGNFTISFPCENLEVENMIPQPRPQGRMR